jgi:hypothetical protein
MCCSMEILNFLENCEQEQRIKSAPPSILSNDLIMRIIQEADGGRRQHKQKFQGVLNYFDVPPGEPIDYDFSLTEHPVAEKGVFSELFDEEWVYNAIDEWGIFPMVLWLFDKDLDDFMENSTLISLLAKDGNVTAQKYISGLVD